MRVEDSDVLFMGNPSGKRKQGTSTKEWVYSTM